MMLTRRHPLAKGTHVSRMDRAAPSVMLLTAPELGSEKHLSMRPSNRVSVSVTKIDLVRILVIVCGNRLLSSYINTINGDAHLWYYRLGMEQLDSPLPTWVHRRISTVVA